MARTPIQDALRTDILASSDPDVIAARDARNDTELARLYNLNSTFVVWRLAIPAMELGKTVIYNALAGLTTANSNRMQVFAALNPEDFNGNADIDAFFSDTFGGALNGDGANCRAALAAMLRRNATRAEALLATGTGSTNNPGDLIYNGSVSIADIAAALNP